MSTYSDHEQRLLDQQTGAEMDRQAERAARRAGDTIANPPTPLASNERMLTDWHRWLDDRGPDDCNTYAAFTAGFAAAEKRAGETSAPLVDLLRDLEIAARHCAVHGDGGANAALLGKARDAVLSYDWCVRAAIREHSVETSAEPEPANTHAVFLRRYLLRQGCEFARTPDEVRLFEVIKFLEASPATETTAEPEAVAVLRALLSNPHIALGDLIYQVREREGEGWDGPSVLAWSEAVTNVQALLLRFPLKAEGNAVPHVMPTIDKQAQ